MIAYLHRGAHGLGSAVVIGTESVATTCHVLHRAQRVEVEHRGRKWLVRSHAAEAERDRCLLTVPGLRLPVVRIRASASLAIGERVTPVAYR